MYKDFKSRISRLNNDLRLQFCYDLYVNGLDLDDDVMSFRAYASTLCDEAERLHRDLDTQILSDIQERLDHEFHPREEVEKLLSEKEG